MPPKRVLPSHDIPTPSERPVRARTNTAKLQENVDQEAAKEANKIAKATTKALRERQANEEAAGFIDTGKDVESEDPSDYEDFTSRTVDVDSGSFKRNPKLIRRVTGPLKDVNRSSMLQDISNEIPLPTTRNMNLVRRVSRIPNADTPVFYQANDETHDANYFQDSQPYGAHHIDSRFPSLARDVEPCIQSSGSHNTNQYDNGWSSSPQYQHDTHPARMALAHRGARHDESPSSMSSFSATPFSATRKRDAPLEPTTDALTMQVVKMPKTGSGGGSKVRASDFESLVQAVLEVAYHHFRCHICTEQPYPDRIQEQEFATTTWAKGCRVKGVTIAFDEDMFKLITARGSQVRGQIKTKARLHAEALFKLETPSDTAKTRQMRERVEDLKDRMAFVYKDPVSRKGIFEHPVISKVINSVWFADQHGEGVEYSEYFRNGIPVITIALVLAAIENVLDEWQTGRFHPIQFSEVLYSNKFHGYVRMLEHFAKRTQQADILPKIQRRLLKKARRNANVPEATTEAVPLTDVNFDAAIGEWEDRVNDSDSESIDGEEGM